MKVSIHMIPIEKFEFNFFFNQDHLPVIDVEGKIYTSLPFLFRDFSFLSNPHYKEKVAQIINFILKGLEFHYIENIEEFKENYRQQIEAEEASLSDFPTRLSDYGIYDLSTMHPPAIQDDKLIFFVKHDYTQLPYKVSVNFPIKSDFFKAKYELLPHKEKI